MIGTDDLRLRRDDAASLRLKFKQRRFQMIDDTIMILRGVRVNPTGQHHASKRG